MISGLLLPSSTQILLNGIPGDFIAHWQGFRQDDPLSPVLFILTMDVLIYIILRASEKGLLQPLSSRPIQIWMSLYADDVAILLRPAADEIHTVLVIL